MVDFDTTGFFAPARNAGSGPGLNTEVAAHEVAEWMNDPFTNNQADAGPNCPANNLTP